MKTGFKELDEIIELNKGELIVIASRPNMGKSTFILNILSHISLKEKKSVLLFNLEDSKENIINKLIISNSIGIKQLKEASIYIASEVPYLVDDIYFESRKLKEEKNIEAIIIDYLQLIQFDKKKLLSRDNEITEILRRLKILAKVLNVPVIVISQLSRRCETRDDKRPIIADFSSSKNGILTYSNKILFLYRDSYYNNKNVNNITEVIIAKNNGGSSKTIKIAWLPEYCKFGNLELRTKKYMEENYVK